MERIATPSSSAAPLAWAAAALLLAAPGCDRDDGDSSSSSGSSGTAGTSGTSGTTGGFWAVGETGTMVRTTPAGTPSIYPEQFGVNLWAIACVGADEAWVAGDAGTVLRTVDAGATWQWIETGRTEDLHAVAVAEDAGVVYVAGDGVLLAAPPSGTFEVVGDLGSVTALAAAHVARAFAVTAEGRIFRIEGRETTVPVFDAGVPLLGVDVDASADVVIAVGAAGSAFASHDGGATFLPIPTGIDADLHAVSTVGAGGAFVAVGEGGRVVRYDGIEVEAVDALDPAEELRAIHLRADGIGQVAGTGGLVFVTSDGGRTWTPQVVENRPDLTGIDDFRPHPHA